MRDSRQRIRCHNCRNTIVVGAQLLRARNAFQGVSRCDTCLNGPASTTWANDRERAVAERELTSLLMGNLQ